jgi:hypothetical protein
VPVAAPDGPPTRAPAAPSRIGGGLPLSVALALAASGLYAYALHEQHVIFRTFAFDLGLLGQVAWNSLHGRLFATSVMPFNYLAEHLSPVLLLVAPVYLLWDDAEALLWVQAAAIGLAGIGVYAAARARLADPVAALALQAAFHVAPATGWVANDEFHPGALAMAPVAFATALLWRGRIGWAAVVAGATLLTKEDAVFWVAPFGLLLAVVGGRRAWPWGLGLAGLAVLWLGAYMFVVVPAVRPAALAAEVPHPNIGAFSECGRTVGEVLACFARDPVATLRRATTPGDLEALAFVHLPTGGLGLLGPSMLVALPRWLVLLLGNDPSGIRAHYAALMAVAAYLAAAEAIGWAGRRRVGAGIVLGLSAAGYLVASPLPGGGAYDPPSAEARQRLGVMARAVDLVHERDASVVATSSLLAHLALRERVYLLYDPPDGSPEYRLFDLRDPYPHDGDALRAQVAYQRSDPSYRVLLDEADLVVMRREREEPELLLEARFGRLAELHGVTVEPRGEQLRVSMFWRLLGASRTPHHFFLHLVDARGKGVGQQDGALVGGRMPSTGFRAGVEIREVVDLPAPAASDPDGYALRIGWYDVATGERVHLPDGRDHVALALPAG